MGFKFNGVHSDSLGIAVRSKNRPILPKPKTIFADIPSCNGVYDFSEQSGHVMYSNREVTVDCSFFAKSMADLRKKVREIAAWLGGGEARLIFDDESSVYYLARVSNHIGLEQQISKIGSFTVVFTCRPFAYSSYVSGEVPEYGTEIYYGGGACYDGLNIFQAGEGGVVPCVDGQGDTFVVENLGTYVRPKIVLEGSISNVRIGMGDSFIQYAGQSEGVIVFDCEKMKAVLNGMNITNQISGGFFELLPGSNVMSISADSIDCTIRFVFNFLYL